MSISPIHSFSSVYSINQPSQKASLEQQFQKAFEELNTDLILHLLDQGANPNQKIILNDALRQSLLKQDIDYNYNREESLARILYITENCLPENLKAIESDDQDTDIAQLLNDPIFKKILEAAQLIKQDLNQRLTVSDETIKAFNYQVLKEMICDCCDDECEQLAFPPLEIARHFAGFIGETTLLMQRLIDAGAIDDIN